jgi:hypothetical protein
LHHSLLLQNDHLPRHAWDKHTGKVCEESVSRRPFALSHAHAGKVKRLYLDIYASNHGGSEEFWYSSSASPQPEY